MNSILLSTTIEIVAVIDGDVWARRLGSCQAMKMPGRVRDPLRSLAVACCWANSDAEYDEYAYEETCRRLEYDLREARYPRIIQGIRGALRRLGGEFKRG